jgi:CheY-like chemotaxis protein
MALILIVDDSPTEVHVMKKALEKSGYQTATAQDGAEGVRMAREMIIERQLRREHETSGVNFAGSGFFTQIFFGFLGATNQPQHAILNRP